MNFNSVIRKCIYFLLSIINKEYLVEYWRILKNEKNNLANIYNFYSGFITNNMKVIDVGANIGNYSRVFINSGAIVIGVEPQKYCHAILKKRFRSDAAYKLVHYAAGAVESVGEIHKSGSHTIASMNKYWIDKVKKSNRFNGEHWNKTETISVTTLDKIIKENFMPDYIKIDVEGFELEVIKGLTHPVKFISFEITLPEMKQPAIDCLNEIVRIGEYTFAIPNGPILAEQKQWYSHSEIIEQIETLSRNSKNISTDIYCKKNINPL